MPSIDGLKCVACDISCLTCSGRQDYCTSCGSGKYLQSTSCVVSCSTGIGINGICEACPTGCASCDKTLNCLICSGDYFNAGGSCMLACPSSLPIISGRTCTSCTSPCLSCNASNYCFSCSSPSLVLKGECLS